MTESDYHLQFFFAFLKKITIAKSSANFLSPDPNGQDYHVQFFASESCEIVGLHFESQFPFIFLKLLSDRIKNKSFQNFQSCKNL